MIFTPSSSETPEPEIVTASFTRNSAGIVPSVEKRMRTYTLSTLIHSPCASDHWRSTLLPSELSIRYSPFCGAALSSV